MSNGLNQSERFERDQKAAEQWTRAKRSLKRGGVGCLILAALFAAFLIYAAGYLAAQLSGGDCITRESVSTP